MPDDPEKNQHWVLAGFDPCTGLCKKVHYPEQFRGMDTWVKPFEYQNSVAVMVQSTPGLLEEQMIDMYVLEDGNCSWIPMYSIGPLPFLEFHQPQQSFKTGLIVLKDLLQKTPGSYLYDPKASCLTHLMGIDNLTPCWVESYSQSESLVTIEGMELIMIDRNKKTKPKKMNRTELLSKDFESALHL